MELNSSMKLSEKISNWIKEYSINSKTTSLVIGISGGIDSAVISTLCAMTGLQTIAVRIPIKSHENGESLSFRHSIWLRENYPKNTNCVLIDQLEEAYTGFVHALLPYTKNNELGLANSKSRLRMMTLYQIASSVNGLVIGTGNKIEDFGVGFFTKYGDGGVDISPIGDLTKTQVRELARELGILEDIINAAPTDGLWNDDRTDEKQLGATYEELEFAMNYIEENSDKMFYDLDLFDQRKLEVLEIYKKFHEKNLHKMIPIPIFKLS